MDESLPNHENHQKGDYILIQDVEHGQLGLFDKPLPCCGCGIGWFSFLLGFIFPVMWYYGTILYFGNYYQKDPRERAGLAANAIACRIILATVTIAGSNMHCFFADYTCCYSPLILAI